MASKSSLTSRAKKLNQNLKVEIEVMSARRVLNDAEKKQLTDVAVKEWLHQLRDAIYDIEDVVYEINIPAELSELEAGRSGSRTLFQVQNFSSSSEFTVPNIEERVVEIIKSVIPIVGMGGIGKTALAQLVYNDIDCHGINRPFVINAWITLNLMSNGLFSSPALFFSYSKDMESRNSEASNLREALSALSLESKESEGTKITGKVLVGKLLSTRVFKRFSLADIIKQSWQLRGRVQIEKIKENIFKFSFSDKLERDRVYERRPWSMDGAHLILKEWSVEVALEDVQFDTSSLFMQIHGLPPKLLHTGVALAIGRQIGGLHEFSISRCGLNVTLVHRCSSGITLPGFFQFREDG
ncbi:hypothetical protein FNV43_RR22247 [Rhamnella rubrinervis]|uniref:Uncharacterized protein n=1 Tax=Rhamnella rubrinervis TaxID=2594499 RepID=A0A8K0GV13_9ROSA|nr:hypothetical protein FNV43_RR22247 [Rhamnella rubrinervis]